MHSYYTYVRFIALCFPTSTGANPMDEAGLSFLAGSICRGLCIQDEELSVRISKRSAQTRKMEARRAKTPAHAGGLVHDSLPARARPNQVE
jgi:hypothetical protein